MIFQLMGIYVVGVLVVNLLARYVTKTLGIRDLKKVIKNAS